jgi:hypothetical protein
MLRGMSLPDEPSNDRRSVPRHLRDTEHDGVRDTGASGIRATDAKPGGTRGVITLVALLALAAVVVWYVLAA